MVTSTMTKKHNFNRKSIVMMFKFCRQNSHQSEDDTNSLSLINEKKYLEAFDIYCQIKEHITILSCHNEPIYSNNIINIGNITMIS